MKKEELDKEIENGNITIDYKSGYLESRKETLKELKEEIKDFYIKHNDIMNLFIYSEIMKILKLKLNKIDEEQEEK